MIIIRTQNMENILKCEDIIQYDGSIKNLALEKSTVLAKYATKERAKEVMGEIWTTMINGFEFYSMPEK